MQEISKVSDRVDKASATKTVDWDRLLVGQTKGCKIGIHILSAWRSAIKGTVWNFHRAW